MSLSQALYGEPEKSLPALCALLGLGTGLATRSWVKGLMAGAAAGLLWNQASKRLVITDQRLGPVQLNCPPQDPAGNSQIWLTFDDGPGPETLAIVRQLNEARQRATFFFIGEQVESYQEHPELINLLRKGDHTVANHSWSHPNMLTLSKEESEDQVWRTQELLGEVYQELVTPLFRPPFGYRNSQLLEQLRKSPLELVGWDLNSLDFLKGPVENLLQRVERRLAPGSILLFHDGRQRRQRTAEALPLVLDLLHRRGLTTYCPRGTTR